jgi:hypothetical protein
MFNVSTYTLQTKTNSNQYTLVDIHFIPKDIHIYDISSSQATLQYILYPPNINKNIILSYDSGNYKDKMVLYKVLYSYLIQNNSIISDQTNISPVAFQILNVKTNTLQDTLFFKSGQTIYKVKIKIELHHIFIKVGGNFDDCMEVFIYMNGQLPYIAQIYSEPECGYTTLLEQGEIIQMIKSTLQLCQMIFGVSQFKLKDNSNIECLKTVKTRKNTLPRKLKKPLSLAHLSIVNSSKTWYERHFQAYLENPQNQNRYKQCLDILNQSIDMSYEDFARMTTLTNIQYSELKPYYESAKSWMDFFKSIPKDRQCDLFPWLSTFMDKKMNFSINDHYWIINLGSLNSNSKVNEPIMIRTNLAFLHSEPNTSKSVYKNQSDGESIVVRMSNSGPSQTIF